MSAARRNLLEFERMAFSFFEAKARRDALLSLVWMHVVCPKTADALLGDMHASSNQKLTFS
jgi:hypothetical protein